MRRKNAVPSLLFHRHTGQFYIIVDRKRRYLGNDEGRAQKEYARICGLPPSLRIERRIGTLLVAEAVDLFLGEAVPELDIRDRQRMHFALGVLAKEFGAMTVEAFRVREVESLARTFGSMKKRNANRKIEARDGPVLSMRYVRKLLACVRQCWRWLALRDLVTAESAAKVSLAVRSGKTFGGPDRLRTRPVAADVCAKVLAECRPMIRDMAKLQILTGMRTGELLALTPDQVDQASLPWIYRPRKHKNTHRGKDRTIYLSAAAVEILAPYFVEPCFPIKLNGYNDALRRAAARAKVPPFRAYQLRHAAATEARIAHGDEFAQRILGHAGKGLLERYTGTAEEERQRRAG